MPLRTASRPFLAWSASALALQAAAYRDVDPYPLDVLDAESEGMIGYVLERALRNALGGAAVATLLTQVVVRADDPALTRPRKPIGQIYSREEAAALARNRGWTVAPDTDGFRRVVASPAPRAIVELEAIERLVAAGVEAVVDKDLTAALLAERLGVARSRDPVCARSRHLRRRRQRP